MKTPENLIRLGRLRRRLNAGETLIAPIRGMYPMPEKHDWDFYFELSSGIYQRVEVKHTKKPKKSPRAYSCEETVGCRWANIKPANFDWLILIADFSAYEEFMEKELYEEFAEPRFWVMPSICTTNLVTRSGIIQHTVNPVNRPNLDAEDFAFWKIAFEDIPARIKPV